MSRAALTTLIVLLGSAGSAAVLLAATIAWGIHPVIGALCVAMPTVICAIAIRRHGLGIVGFLAFVMPVVTWILVCCALRVDAGMRGGA